MGNGRAWLAVFGATLLGFGVAVLIHIAAQGHAGTNAGFPALGLLAGFGLGLMLAAFLISPTVVRAEELPPEPWRDMPAPTPEPGESLAAGWFADPLHPDDEAHLRYWNGYGWTGAMRYRR